VQQKAKHKHDRSPTEDTSSGLPRRRGRVLAYGDSASRPCGTLRGAGNAASGGLRVCRERSLFAFSSWNSSLRSGEDPVGELGRAASAHEVDYPMEIDVDPAREFPRRLLIIPCPPKLGPAPHRGPVWPSRDRRRYWRRLSGCSGGTSTKTRARPSGSRATISKRPHGFTSGSSSIGTPLSASRSPTAWRSRT